MDDNTLVGKLSSTHSDVPYEEAIKSNPFLVNLEKQIRLNKLQEYNKPMVDSSVDLIDTVTNFAAPVAVPLKIAAKEGGGLAFEAIHKAVDPGLMQSIPGKMSYRRELEHSLHEAENPSYYNDILPGPEQGLAAQLAYDKYLASVATPLPALPPRATTPKNGYVLPNNVIPDDRIGDYAVKTDSKGRQTIFKNATVNRPGKYYGEPTWMQVNHYDAGKAGNEQPEEVTALIDRARTEYLARTKGNK